MPISKLSIFTGMVFVSIYAQEQVAKPRTSIWMYLGKHNFTCVHVVGNHMKMGHAYLIVYVQGFVSRLSTRSGGMKYSNLAFVLTTLIGSSVLRTFSFKFAKYIYIYNYNYNLSNLSQQDHEYMLNQGKVFLQAFTIADDTPPLATPRGFSYPKRQHRIQGFGNVGEEDRLGFLEIFSGQDPTGL